MNLLDYPIVLTKPRYVSGSLDWIMNIPFGGWLMQATQPRLFVELGVAYGDSYMAFCHAAAMTSPQTRCIGIDAWTPTWDFKAMDSLSHKVQRLFAEHERYAHFSELRKSSFDDAVKTFADGSIDLLHIDGNHLEADQDFSTWLPKLSSRGVVLMHDIKLRGINSSMPETWATITEQYPRFFEFSMGTGLGVVCVGPQAPIEVENLCSLRGSSTEPKIQFWFTTLGAQIQFLVRRGYYDEGMLNEHLKR